MTYIDLHYAENWGFEPLRYPKTERRWFRCPTTPKAVHRLGFQSQRPNSINSKATLHCGHFMNLLDKISFLGIKESML